MLAVSGSETYAIYLYADGLIQWTTGDETGINGLGGVPAIVGYSFGDGIISYTVPGSLSTDIINIASISNIGEPGKWVFRLDEDDVVLPRCNTFLGNVKLALYRSRSLVALGICTCCTQYFTSL